MAENTVLGIDELNKDFQRLDAAVGAKFMRSAAGYAFTPVLSSIKAQAPVSKKAHKTYKGRVVAPGFLKRSLKKVTRKSRDNSRAYAFVWAEKEAFYGFQFVVPGTKYIRGNNFAQRGFDAAESQAVQRFSIKLKERIDKAAEAGK